MLALLAISRSRREKPRAVPTPSSSPRWAASAMAEKANRMGAVRSTRPTSAAAPTAAKKTWSWAPRAAG